MKCSRDGYHCQHRRGNVVAAENWVEVEGKAQKRGREVTNKRTAKPSFKILPVALGTVLPAPRATADQVPV
jgi:hypothetical protein